MSDSSLNPLLVLGMVALVAGAIALVYGHMELLDAQQNSGFLGMGGGGDGETMKWQIVRLGGLVVAGVGGVLTFSGAVND
ncbi:hypothetical protein [Natronomonas marina]|jgi:hypothetical protein|uniref:hypothetical protein n=1 Tax=Natronomonas marina TaxID=2961939 RepID=UPI0020C9D68F|nr:hypothetical protein [Natronomonas marina]